MADQESRRNALYRKLTPQEFEIKDKVVMLVDDSIVRGTTSQAVIDMVRKAGAKKIYFVSASPEIRYPDFYGIDIASKGELLADGKTVDQIRQFIGADLLMYQDIDDLFEAITRKGSHTIDQLSMPWFDGKYITGDINFPTLKPKSIDNNLIDKILADNYNL
jgi:amidophosphoribosyltransferase